MEVDRGHNIRKEEQPSQIPGAEPVKSRLPLPTTPKASDSGKDKDMKNSVTATSAGGSVRGTDAASKTAFGIPKVIGIKPDDKLIQELFNKFEQACEKEFEEAKKNPKYENMSIREWLTDKERLNNGEKPRIEQRVVPGTEPEVIGNIALCFVDGSTRDEQVPLFKKQCPQLSLVSAGQTTLEIGNFGVDKGTTINFVDNHFSDLLSQMHYIPGPRIDARTHQSVIISDFDGTITDKPEKGTPPESSNLGNSAARAGVLNYLRAGGILIINSGNDPQRVANRLLAGIPEDERNVLLSRVAIAAAGGHAFLVFDKEGNLEEVKDYRQNALNEQEVDRESDKNLHIDVMYLGDDEKINGNDFPAFQKVGEGKFICVSNKVIPEKSGMALAMEETKVPGETVAVNDVFNGVVNHALINPKQKLFTHVAQDASNARSMPEANNIIASSLTALGGRSGVNNAIVENEKLNGAGYHKKETIDKAIIAYKEVEGDKSDTEMNYDQITALSNRYEEKLSEQGLTQLRLRNNLEPEKNPEIMLKSSLKSFNLKNNDVIRILLPGNNDQSNPMYVGMQVKWIKEFAKENNINLNVEILVMGRGGHATTSAFPQFMQVSKDKDDKFKFEGVNEADSLTGTLEETLKELEIPYDEPKLFGNHSGKVQIKREVKSTNTGENADYAGEATRTSKEEPGARIVTVVSSATSQATRQLLTFAQQLSEDRLIPTAKKLYDDIIAIPLQRGEAFFKNTHNDFQAVMEMYVGLAEQCRYYLYSYKQNPFIPAEPVVKAELDALYSKYAKLANLSLDDAKKDSLQKMLHFFQNRFAVLESATTWNKDPALQQLATKETVIQAGKRGKLISNVLPNLKRAVLEHKILSSPGIQAKMNAEQKATATRLINAFNELKGKIEDPATDDQKKQVIYTAMAALAPQMKALKSEVLIGKK